MSNKPLIPESKLPSLGTTIFTQMSALAQQHQAINLSQGFPDFDGRAICRSVWRITWRRGRTSTRR
jgi:aspartate/methionine/tyrosine aminotransferase